MRNIAWEKVLNDWTMSVYKKIAKNIGDREATIALEIADLFSNDDRDRDRDLNSFKDRNRNFGDLANALHVHHSYWRSVGSEGDGTPLPLGKI